LSRFKNKEELNFYLIRRFKELIFDN
jgi:hypothetical protein